MVLSTNNTAIYHLSDLTDSSTNSYTLTNNGASQTTDKNSITNQAYSFNGSSNYMSSSIPNLTNMSISFWFKSSDVISQKDMVAKSINTDLSYIVGFYAGNLRMYFKTSSGAAWITISAVSTGTWYHFVFTYDGVNLKIYLNNVLKNTTGFTGAVNPTSVLFNIGRRGTTGLYYNGVIDECYVWSRAITSTEVSDLYNNYDNAFVTGYSNKVNGIIPSKINGIAVANISKFNGV